MTDNGTLVTLGLVGLVAAAGAATQRGSAARRSRVQDGVYRYTSATGSQLVLKGPGAPNLDAMTPGELMAFWHATYTGGWEIARFLFPDRPKGYLRATEQLGAYASNTATAKTLRAEKKPKDAEMYERIAGSVYEELPMYAKWTRSPAASRARGSRSHDGDELLNQRIRGIFDEIKAEKDAFAQRVKVGDRVQWREWVWERGITGHKEDPVESDRVLFTGVVQSIDRVHDKLVVDPKSVKPTVDEVRQRPRTQLPIRAFEPAAPNGSRATLDERVADLQFDVTTLFGARELRRPSELRALRERVLAQNRDLLTRIKEGQERGVDTSLLERDLRARIR